MNRTPAGDAVHRLDPEVPLFHLALVDEWELAVVSGRYDRSTIRRSLAEEGFIHASLAAQVQGTAEAFYTGQQVVLLTIDQALVPDPIRLERVPDGRLFPHIHGPIPLEAVTSVLPVPMLPDGSHDFSELLGP